MTGPRFPTEVQQSFREYDMRRMQTEHLKIYYPEHRAEEAHRVATRLEGCLAELEEHTVRTSDWGLVPIFLPEAEFNNAYVAFGPGNDPHIVVPTFFTANFFGQFGYTPSVSAVGCHEMVHYVHMIQIYGLFDGINNLFGPSINPQAGFDLWFFEGLATYYESQLVEGVGRYGSPIWESVFAAGIADGRIDGGRLSEWDRSVPFGAHYLIGSHFVAYLAETYGEDSLWQVIDRQGESILFPFGVSLRFRAVYGKTLSELIDEFEDAVGERYEVRQRPADQRRLRWVGRTAMLESGPNGRGALFSSDVDSVAALEVFDEAGERLVHRRIPDVLPGRKVLAARGLESLRFSPDGESLYFLVNHQGRKEARTSLMRLDVNDGSLQLVRDNLRAIGGDLIDGEKGYVVAYADGDRVRFRRLDLVNGADEELFSLPPGAYVGWVRVSPDETKVAVTLMEDEQWSVAVFDIDGGRFVGKWTTGRSHRPAFDPFWIDDERLLFVASGDDDIQIVEGRIGDAQMIRHSDVPYMAFNPRIVNGDSIQFLNREDWGWSLDEVEKRRDRPTDRVHFESALGGADITGYREFDAPAQVFDDRSYSQFDRLFVPRLRVPSIAITGIDDEVLEIRAALGLAGRDELGFHNWAIDGMWDFGEERFSGSLAYVNMRWAPWQVTLQLSNRWMTSAVLLDADVLETTQQAQRDRFARLELWRPWYDIPLWLEATAADFLREATVDESQTVRRLLGGEAGAEYRAQRATSYGGAQWMFALSGQAGGYPAQLGSDFSMAHLRSQLEAHTPLPLSNRHRLRWSTRIRALPGVPEEEELLRVGGFGTSSPIFVTGDAEDEPLSEELLPRSFLFAESLRGYEDLGLVGNRVAIADLNYRYPFVIDRGAASSLTVFPAVFLRGINFEVFGAGATLMEGNLHGAVGASLDMEAVFWRVPLRFRYQVAQRLFDDERLVHLLSLGAGGGF